MNSEADHDLDEQTYQRLKEDIDRKYPTGRFVAIANGGVIADAETFEALESALEQMGRDSPEILVVQAGIDEPDDALILLQDDDQ
jgi:hypothetical protein